jgi:gluconokinase
MISFDPNLRPSLWPSQADMVDCLDRLARLADWVLPGVEEGRLLSGHGSADGIAEHYLALGAKAVVVKLGADGAYFATSDERGHAPGVPVPRVVDTVGAGDGFAVGVVSALLEGLPLAQAAERGNRIGARVVQFPGDCDGLPTRAQLAAHEPGSGAGRRVVFMGVSGCGKSTLADRVAAELGLPLVEGDDHHSAASRSKMSRGVALDDTDRDAWLQTLAGLLRQAPAGMALSCSALKRSYRERLRAASPGLRFVFLDLPFDEAQRRVAARAGSHFFSPQLVASQFATLEPPLGEPGVLQVDAMAPVQVQTRAVLQWLQGPDR